MIRQAPHIVIDARPRGPRGPLAEEEVLGRSVLAHLVDLASAVVDGPVNVHARLDEHEHLLESLDDQTNGRIRLVTGPPPENAAILRSDRIYDPSRLRKAIVRGRDLETAVIWRLDQPHAIETADAELIRRRTYQPLGRFWALAPAKWLARLLCPTGLHPNWLTIASAVLVLCSAGCVALTSVPWAAQVVPAVALALALVLDTSDGHLARLQGTTSEFGRWLDANLDELGDMALHAGIAWSCYVRDSSVLWLLAGMAYAMGKYLYLVGATTGMSLEPQSKQIEAKPVEPEPSRLRGIVILMGHADLRWHLWIVLAAVGRLDVALVVYALYFPFRAAAGGAKKAVSHA